EINNEFFILRVIRNEGKNPFEGSIESRLYGAIDNGLDDFDSRAYIFKVYDRNTQENIVISNIGVNAPSDNILEITYNDHVPARAQRIAQEIAQSYIDYDLENKTIELEQTLQFLDKQIVEVKQNLKNKGKKLQEYQQENSAVTMIDSPATIVNLVEEKKEVVDQIAMQIQEIKNFRTSFESGGVFSTVSLVGVGIDTSSIQSLMEDYRANDEMIRELRYQQNDITKSVTLNTQINGFIDELKNGETLIHELSNNFTDEHPQVIEAKRNIVDIENKVHAYIVTNIEKLHKDKAFAKSAILNNILMVQRNLENKLRRLKGDIQQKKALLQSFPAMSLESKALERNFSLSENVYTFLLQKKIEVEISKASMIANTKIIEDAQLPVFPFRPNKKMLMITGILLGLILGIAYVLIKLFLDTKIRSVNDIEKGTRIPLYGTLPSNSNQRFFKEALRNIRTNLQFVLSDHKNCTTILISSTVAGEGKTIITAGLAEVISGAGKRVLLLDLDLRKPSLHKELKQRNKIGMSNYLSGEIDMYEHIIPIAENLDFFSAGVTPPNPSELLMSEKFNQIIGQLEQEYDYILFDTAPIGSVTDANMLLKHSDIVLLVMKVNEAEKIYLKHFDKMVEEKNIKSAGIILNGVKLHKSKSYGYGYGYGYNYAYGDKKER
ncbi:MAG TPA: polysaccharide biosynthesis tyrosine autokinase, partial [Epsilonproteobacteria bacterium]|nr:polysaccharide biosynthesis tyrosine autokinase [Campylobacterota bacterium]